MCVGGGGGSNINNNYDYVPHVCGGGWKSNSNNISMLQLHANSKKHAGSAFVPKKKKKKMLAVYVLTISYLLH